MKIVRDCKECMYCDCKDDKVICNVFGMRVDGAIRRCSVFVPVVEDKEDEKKKR